MLDMSPAESASIDSPYVAVVQFSPSSKDFFSLSRSSNDREYKHKSGRLSGSVGCEVRSCVVIDNAATY